jgi:hypothetical protein
MGKFGWSLPPGCSTRDIDRAYGDEAPEHCLVCKTLLDEESVSGHCPPPKDCKEKLEQMYREQDEAEAKSIEESKKWGAEYEQWRKENPDA